MARLRVYLLTSGRAHLLRRALASLLSQTFVDWTCELHNDAPGDDAPRRILQLLAANDPRFACHSHDRNWGAVATFNHAYAGGPEPYASILEEDNWWEPQFLARVLTVLESFPTAALAWANLRRWREEPDGRWTDTKQTVWTCAPDSPPRAFSGPVALQAVDSLHSHGAMIFRTETSRRALVPPGTPLDIIEPVRERLLHGSLVLVPEVLAHFALTRSTARSTSRAAWLQSQLLVSASFFRRARLPRTAAAALWRHRRRLRPRGTDSLLLAALCGAAPRSMLRHSRPADWLHFIPRALRHPATLRRGLRFRQDHAELWRTLQSAGGPPADAENLTAKILAASTP